MSGKKVYLDQFKNSDGSFSFRKAIAIWDGGLAIYGAVIAVVIVGICVSRHRGYKLGAMLDLAVMGLLIGQCIGRWGNFMNREAFGAETDVFCRMGLIAPDGSSIFVHPTFLYESLWNVGVLLFLFWFRKRKKFNGEVFLMYLIGYGLGRIWIEGLRTDQLLLPVVGLPVSQLLSGCLVVGCTILVVWKRKKLSSGGETAHS